MDHNHRSDASITASPVVNSFDFCSSAVFLDLSHFGIVLDFTITSDYVE